MLKFHKKSKKSLLLFFTFLFTNIPFVFLYLSSMLLYCSMKGEIKSDLMFMLILIVEPITIYSLLIFSYFYNLKVLFYILIIISLPHINCIFAHLFY